jgi:hypothetical protein
VGVRELAPLLPVGQPALVDAPHPISRGGAEEDPQRRLVGIGEGENRQPCGGWVAIGDCDEAAGLEIRRIRPAPFSRMIGSTAWVTQRAPIRPRLIAGWVAPPPCQVTITTLIT